MPSLKEVLDRLQELASSRSGKMIIIILLLLAAILAWVRYCLWAGTLNPLEGTWEFIHNFIALVFFLLLALSILKLILPGKEIVNEVSSRTITKNGTNELSPVVNKKIEQKLDKKRKYSVSFIIFAIGMAIIVIITYIAGWVMVWDGAISPLITDIQKESFIWSSDFIDIVMHIILIIFWIIFPFMLYWEFVRNIKSSKHKK